MPHHPQVPAEGLLYHVMARGNDGQKCESVKLSLNLTVRCASSIRPRFPPARGLRGNCFALRDLCEPRHHRCGILVQDLRARILADLRFR